MSFSEETGSGTGAGSATPTDAVSEGGGTFQGYVFGASTSREEIDMTTAYLGDTLTFWAQTTQHSTGAAMDAAAGPGYRIYEETTDTPLASGTMTLQDDSNTVGFYRGQVTLTGGAGFEIGKCYCVRVTASVDSVAQAGIAERFVVRDSVWSDAAPAASAGRATTMGGMLGQVWRYLHNRNLVDKLSGTQTVYADDQTTPLLTGQVLVSETRADKRGLE